MGSTGLLVFITLLLIACKMWFPLCFLVCLVSVATNQPIASEITKKASCPTNVNYKACLNCFINGGPGSSYYIYDDDTDECYEGRQGHNVGGSCDCNYHSGGCRISSAAPSNRACRCVYHGFWTCTGTVVGCQDEEHYRCVNPGLDKASCAQGNGDCGSY